MLKIGKYYLKPQLCRDCRKPLLLVRHPLSIRCNRCAKRHRRKRPGAKQQQKKYTPAYRRMKKLQVSIHPYCALCGRTDNLTCHHAVRVKTGEWKGRHFTILCRSCHELWETKVNKIRRSHHE